MGMRRCPAECRGRPNGGLRDRPFRPGPLNPPHTPPPNPNTHTRRPSPPPLHPLRRCAGVCRAQRDHGWCQASSASCDGTRARTAAELVTASRHCKGSKDRTAGPAGHKNCAVGLTNSEINEARCLTGAGNPEVRPQKRKEPSTPKSPMIKKTPLNRTKPSTRKNPKSKETPQKG